MKIGAGKTLRRASVAAVVLALASCGGDETARPPVTVITPEPVRGVIAQTSFSGFQSDVFVALEIPITQKGVVDITVDWTFPDTWMYVYLGNTNCSYSQLAARTCPFFLKSETKDPKPRTLVTQSLDAGTYYLVLYNVPRDPLTGHGSDNTEAVSIQLGLTVYPFTNHVPGAISIGRTQVLGPQN
jgi:hypothetical protein